ncbi:MAG: twin-arginine translocation signal domain-containing protein, partial [Betaproteobacteria bacterium]|nr:twin-arginine translocation signal domain-containing protein [Betaproteobacteria bacterium]
MTLAANRIATGGFMTETTRRQFIQSTSVATGAVAAAP